MNKRAQSFMLGAFRRGWPRLQADARAGIERHVPRSQWPALATFLEIGAATSLLWGFAGTDLARYGGAIIAGLLGRGVLAQFALADEAPGQAFAVIGSLVGKAVLALAPVVRMAWRWPRHRLLWLPVPLFAVLGLLAIAMFPPVSWVWWFAFVAAGATGCLLARRRVGVLAAFLPAVCLAIPHAGHIYGPLVHDEDTLARTCPRNDGVRPRNLRPFMLSGSYFAVTPMEPDLWLLTGLEPDAPLVGIDRRWDQGRGGSWWIADHGPAGIEVLGPSAVQGNLWRGCRIGDSLWFTRVRQLIRVSRRGGSSSPEEVERLTIPMRDMDVSEVACDTANLAVYLGEATQGGLWRWSLRDGAWTRWDLGFARLGVFPRVRSDGRLVVAATDALLVFDPDRGEVIESHPAGYFVHGVDVCAMDQGVVMADLAGWVRFFAMDEAGSYRLAGTVEVPAARRVAFSPDCRTVAATAYEEATVSIIRTDGLEVVRRFRVGPVVRDVTFVGPRRVVIADACTATVLEW